MNPEAGKRLRLLASAVSIILLVAIVAVAWFYWRVRASLPQLEGRATAPGLSTTVTLDRDALGVPTIRGANRADVARALGWLHGQERFFQMDVLRRAAAGELAEIFGERALPRDRAVRIHGFRKLAQAVVSREPDERRAVLDAYVSGVNAGLAALDEKPFEYLVLREDPQPWRAEDSILIIYAMTLDLQDESGGYERSLMTLRDKFGSDAVAFFAPLVSPVDAALDGSTAPLPPIPGPDVINLRGKKLAASSPPGREEDPFPFPARDPESVPGSNAFALAGRLTASGSAILANDMHLDHGVPNTWYRAVLEFAGQRIVGVTLPGAPAVVAGSNGHVAWGFTNGCVDTSDLVQVEVNSTLPSLYLAPGYESYLEIKERKEIIQVNGDDPERVEYPWTIWGPVVGADEEERPLALRWVAHDPEATNLALMDMEGATTVDEAIAIAHRAGIPAQNILLADEAGDIAWTVAGRLPERVGYDGRLPVSWTFGDRRWDGFLPSSEVPVIRGTESVREGRLWSANQRHIGGAGLASLGDGGYARSHRAAQIRDGIAALTRATPQDLLAVQLDDRALFLERWHALLLATLTSKVTAGNEARAALRSHAEKWEDRASTGAVSYWLVREFRLSVYERVFSPIFEPCKTEYPEFDRDEFQLEPAMWALLETRPIHLLDSEYETWEALLAAACDDVIKETDKLGVEITKATWGSRNRARIRHPFSSSFPWLASWLDMPADPLPGGADMPRVQSSRHGASQRLVVSPGREDEAIFHMPGGQSGHPMSPHYRAGHEAWVRGEPTPLLPGETAHTLTLEP